MLASFTIKNTLYEMLLQGERETLEPVEIVLPEEVIDNTTIL